LGPRFVDYNPAERDRFLRLIKIHSMTSFREEVKPLDPCHRILQHVKDSLRYMIRDTDKENSFLAWFLLALLLGCKLF
jgi:hypothetical protein